MKYNVLYADGVVGAAEITNEGLYSRFVCKCNVDDVQMLRLTVAWDDKRLDLGIGIPEGEVLCWNTRIPTKRLGKGTPGFVLSKDSANKKRKLVPVSPSEPFPEIENLENSVFCLENGQPMLVITKTDS